MLFSPRMSAYSQNWEREYAEEIGNEQSLIRKKTVRNETSKGWLWVKASPETTPRLVQFVHHCMSQGCAQGHKQVLCIGGSTSTGALQNSCNEMRGDIQERGKERSRDRRKEMERETTDLYMWTLHTVDDHTSSGRKQQMTKNWEKDEPMNG